jgi:hypothetical protein
MSRLEDLEQQNFIKQLVYEGKLVRAQELINISSQICLNHIRQVRKTIHN